MAEKKKSALRSVQWFGRQDIYGFIYRSWTKNRGIPQDQFDGRPVIGICNTYSELVPCNSHFRTIAEHVKAGVLEAGGFPLEFPVMSLGETLLRPTAMLYRNLAGGEKQIDSIKAARAAREAAKHHLLVDFHGAYKPTGLRREYPNLMTHEGVTRPRSPMPSSSMSCSY